MATFSSLQASVRNRVIDMPTVVDAEVPALVNQAMQEAQRRNNFSAMRWSQDTLLFAGNTAVVRPRQFKQLRGDPYLSVTETRGYDVRVLDHKEFTYEQTLDFTGAGVPRLLVITDGEDAGTWRAFPESDGEGEFNGGAYRMRVFFWRYFAPLALPSDTNWITENVDQFIIDEATASAQDINENPELSIYWRGLAQQKLDIVIREDRRAVASGKDTLRMPRTAGLGSGAYSRRGLGRYG